MKKIIAITFAAMISVAAFAQVHIGAGYVQSTATYQSKPDADVSSTPSNGFYAGLGYEYPLMEGLSLGIGAYYEYLYSDDASTANLGTVATGTYKTNLKEQYVNVPVTVNFGYNLTPSLRLFAFGGPTASYGLSSVTHYDITGGIPSLGITISDSGDVDNYAGTEDDPCYYGKFDVLLGAGAGAEINGKFRLTFGYDWGLMNRNTNPDDTAVRNRNQLRAGLAVLF